MTKEVDLYRSTYGSFTEPVFAAVRRETFGEDIGQNSWLTADELRGFARRLELGSGLDVLEVACGSGGAARLLAREHGCRVVGVDNSENAVATATRAAGEAGAGGEVRFQVADANGRLPFPDGAFDAVVCIDAINHLADRAGVLDEWHRLLKPGGRVLFTDPIVMNGPLTNREVAVRSSIGFFLFVPAGHNEAALEGAGLRRIWSEDVTEGAARLSESWRAARSRHEAELVRIEGRERFDGLQEFFAMVHRLSRERRLCRIAYLARRAPG